MQLPTRALLFTTISLLLISCGGEEQTVLHPAKGGKFYGGDYHMNEVESIKTLDPVGLNDAPSSHVVNQICELLVDFDSNLTLVPELAERWEVSDDGLSYTYHLRHGIHFQDSPVFPDGKGREMTAKDIKFCFDRILDATTGTKGATYFLGKVQGATDYYHSTGNGAPAAGGVSGFRVVDRYTFAIDLLKPFAAFKYYPALGMCYIYPHEAVEHYGKDFFGHLVGTGPFVLDHWDKDQELVLVRNPHYWRSDSYGNQLPFLDKITFSSLKDEESQLREFKQGKLEESYRIPSTSFRNVVTTDGKLTPQYANYQLHRVEALSTQYYGMLNTSAVFKDPRVRRAFCFAIDRNKIINYVLDGQAAGPAIHGIVPPSMPGYDPEAVHGYSYNLDTARALLAEAGYPGGKGFPHIELQLNSGGGRNRDVAIAVQQMLSVGLGIDVGMKELEWGQHLDIVDRGDAAFYRLGWIADYPDPENFLNLLWSKNIPDKGPSPINSVRYRNPEFDRIFEQARATQNDSARMRLYEQAEQVAMDDAPLLLIYHDMDYRLVQPYVRDYSSNPMDRRDLTWTWFDSNAY